MNERNATAGVNVEDIDVERMKKAIQDMSVSADALAEAMREFGRVARRCGEMLSDAARAKDGAA